MPLRKRSYTADLLTQQQGEVLKVGFLRKKGHVRRNWLDRWFVLTTEGIYYYKNRTVSLCQVCLCTTSHVDGFLSERKNLNLHSVQLCAKSEEVGS